VEDAAGDLGDGLLGLGVGRFGVVVLFL
jgi:hypothetical protein